MSSREFVSMARPKVHISGVVLDEQNERRIVLRDDVQLNKAQNAWKPTTKAQPGHPDDPERAGTQELFGRLRSILNKMTPEKFQGLMEQVGMLRMDTEERLEGAIELIYEKAISEPNFSAGYANMCHRLQKLEVPASDRPGTLVGFHKLLLNRCQREFEKADETFEDEQLEEVRNASRRRSLGIMKFLGELFRLNLLEDVIISRCVRKLLKHPDDESLERLCKLLATAGQKLDSNAKPNMDQYFSEMDKIIRGRKTSSRTRFMLQDIVDLRKSEWVPRRKVQGPKTIAQIHQEVEMEERRERIRVQQLLSKKVKGGKIGGDMRGRGPQTPQNNPWEPQALFQEGPFRPARLTLVSIDTMVLAPGGRLGGGGWAKGCSGGGGALTEERSKAIIEEYLHVNDLKEAVRSVTELHSPSLLYVFVRSGVEMTLDLGAAARQKMALLLHQLVKAGTLSTQQYYRGLEETLQAMEDRSMEDRSMEDRSMEIPHIWLYLAELIAPMLHQGGIPMGQLFRGVSGPLSLGNGGVLLVQILKVLCRGTTHETVGALWAEAGLDWRDFLPEDQDLDAFVTDQNVEFTKAEDPKGVSEEVCKQLDSVLQDRAGSRHMEDRLQADLDKEQT